uniref:DDE_3 domain-containing protein n=1 Tax=Strongyloides papillosus TaxID=174720 RepID=A0A0N5BY68_STREA
MVFACFSSYGRSELTFIDHRIHLLMYQNVLGDNLLPYMKRFRSVSFKFTQDNASYHASAKTKKWISDKKISLIDHPSRSPDLNPIENLWGILVRAVYKDNKQYSTVQELKEAIVKCWDEIPNEKLVSLANSMPNRIFEVISKKGGIQTIKNSFKSLNLNMCYNFAPHN